jgi:hypothetical protein
VRQAAFTLAVDEKAVAAQAMKAGRQHIAQSGTDHGFLCQQDQLDKLWSDPGF